jgi:catechol 2,3-dioxygenase-like lactoylglutathione lyase family enzyme
MQIARLDHVNLRTTQLEVMTQWYSDLLGLKLGPRPNFPFPGAWLYAGDVAIIHLIEVEDTQAIGSEQSLKLEHFALRADSRLEKFEDKLKAKGERYRRGEITEFGIMQFNIWDPDGNHIHVDFDMEDEDLGITLNEIRI